MCHLRLTIYDFIRRAGTLLTVAALGAGLAGCNDKFFDPTQIGRFRPTPTVNVILDSLGVAEEAPVAWETGEEPRPSDIVVVKADYVLQPGDLVRVSIFELLQEGIALVSDYMVSETGKLSIPDVGVIQAAGLTETQLEEEIKQILSPNVLREPSITVTLLNSQQRTFAVLGNGVARPNRYVIPRYDFRLMDALSTAGAQMQFNVSYVYVSRKEEGAGKSLDGGTEKRVPELELIEPQGQSRTQTRASDPLVALLPPGSPTRTVASGGAPRSDESRLESRVPSLAPAGGGNSQSAAPSPQSRADIPEPSEPAARFETEREMLEMIAPSAQGNAALRSGAPLQNANWPTSGKIVETATPAAKGKEGDVAATVMPYGFRLLGPSKPQAPQKPAPYVATQSLASVPVQSPVEFGNSSLPAGTQNLASAPAGSNANERIEWIFKDGKWVPVPVADGSAPVREQPATAVQPGLAPAPGGSAPVGPGGGIEWVFRDGLWVPVQKGETPPANGAQRQEPVPGGPRLPLRAPEPQVPTLPLDDTKLPMDLEWEQAIQTRLIRIPADKLLAGDPRYNITIKPGDTIHVPVDIIGEFAIMGNVNRSGLINITGRPMTLKMAIAAAGGLGPLAWPKHVEVVRRLGTKKEEIVLVDLDKIARGEQPDFFVKPNDLINVGTEATARWRAVLRNAFRAAYGFGFVYDRNFADADYGTGFPNWL